MKAADIWSIKATNRHRKSSISTVDMAGRLRSGSGERCVERWNAGGAGVDAAAVELDGGAGGDVKLAGVGVELAGADGVEQ
jgi:hypothetical protein